MSKTLENFVTNLKQQIGNAHILTDSADTCVYSYDDSSLRSLPAVVALPTDIAQIQKIVHMCREFGVPLTARGGGTGTTGASLACPNGLVLSLARMNRLIRMDAANRVMVVEPGITNAMVQNIAQKEGFFWPPDPGSAANCTVGGNLACNAAGPHAIKYGATWDNTLGLTVVTGEGELLKTGTYTTKGAVGYDFTRLFIGSEGTLGIIVEATLKLTPLPEAKTTIRILYDSIMQAATAVSQIMTQPVVPCALEFMDAMGLQLLNQNGNFFFPENTQAMLLIEVDGSAHTLQESCHAIKKAAQRPGLITFEAAQDAEASEALWKARKALSPALRTLAPKKINEDVVVPVSKMPDFIERMQILAKKYQIMIVNFGHAGNGNIHVNLLIHPENPSEVARADACLEEIFDCVFALNGTLSGEHGIGLVKKPFIERALDATSLKLMRKVKAQFDPAGILNPGKIFD
jgi:D-lactate dehydrogenase